MNLQADSNVSIQPCSEVAKFSSWYSSHSMINRLILSLREEAMSQSQGVLDSATQSPAMTDTITGDISFLSRATFVEEHDLRTT
jgi:hypothetical protein